MSKNIVLGVTGSIAAYKAAYIASALQKQGCTVNVIMTENATRFITPLTMETLTKQPVASDMWQRNMPYEVEHISLAQKADVFLVAPASANFIGKLANGIADDMLSTTAMATAAPILIAPAMNTAMYESPAMQKNLQILRERGCIIIEPGSGMLACGDVGKGRLAEPDDIVDAALFALHKQKDYSGLKVLVTAGPTREALDPVRYITNRSSGKMGYAIAAAAARRGADVTLVSGPTVLKTPYGVKRIDITSTQDMYEAMMREFTKCDIAIKAAAPADFTAANYSQQKIKKAGKQSYNVELSATQDILKALGEIKGGRILVGFAAETRDLEEYASKKLVEKNLDMIVANDVSAQGAGFAGDTNIVTLIQKDKMTKLPMMKKEMVADSILDITLKMVRK